MKNTISPFYHIDSKSWQTTKNGDPRGYIQPSRLTELWFHTGTDCNLGCWFCLEGSGPKNHRIEPLTLDDAKPLIDEALELGVEKFSFTGGEPFVNPEFVDILSYALEKKQCLILTNGTAPIRKVWDKITALAQKGNDLSFRISIDYPDAKRHDDVRGQGSFKMALKTLARLHELGFTVSIARQKRIDEPDDTDAQYRKVFDEFGIPSKTKIIAFPELHQPETEVATPAITENCMTTYKDENSRSEFMCDFSKMVLKKNGRLSIYACTLVDDDEDYDLGSTLREAMKPRVMLKHHRCYACFSSGASCSEM